MLENRYYLEKKFHLKISLSFSATLNDSIELENNSPIYNLLSEYSEIEDIYKINKPDKMKYLYFNRNIIKEILYDKDKVIEINSNLIQNKLSDYFYLALLIEYSKNITNFAYSYSFIKEVNENIKSNNNNDMLREVVISKIILELINHYRGTNEYYDKDNIIKNEINDLETINRKRIENIVKKIKDLKLNAKDIINNKIEQIYVRIIEDLIKTNKIDDNKITYNIIKQLDIENIYITQAMFEELNDIFKSDNDCMKKYIINDKRHLHDKNTINFYYTLFKYIFKKRIYIYQIPFLVEIRKNIIEIIKANLIEEKDEKLKFIISFFTDHYYTAKLNNFIKNKYYYILQHEENLEDYGNDTYIELIREISNGYILKLNILNNKNEINDTPNNKNKKDNLDNNSNSKNSKNRTRSKTRKYSEDDENINFKYLEINSDGKSRHIYNIIETNESIKNKDKDKKEIQVMECSKEGLMINNLSLDGDQKEIKTDIHLSCTGCFEVKNNNYIVIGEKGIFHFDSLNTRYNYLYYRIHEMPFRGCIKINDDYIVLTSNSILQNGGDDLLCIYDTNINRLIHKIYYSFTVGANGLILMDILLENNKNKQLILCACKKYKESQKNGIVIIDTNIGEKKRFIYTFNDTHVFEVSCFCPLSIKKENKMIPTNYFLAGGLEKEKKQGAIKLYKVRYYEKNNDKIKFEFLQDIEIETNDKFQGFNGDIICMLQSRSNGKIFISSSDGKLELFSEPNLDYYLKEDQTLQKIKN